MTQEPVTDRDGTLEADNDGEPVTGDVNGKPMHPDEAAPSAAED